MFFLLFYRAYRQAGRTPATVRFVLLFYHILPPETSIFWPVLCQNRRIMKAFGELPNKIEKEQQKDRVWFGSVHSRHCAGIQCLV